MVDQQLFLEYFYQSWNNSNRDLAAYQRAIVRAEQQTGTTLVEETGISLLYDAGPIPISQQAPTYFAMPSYDQLAALGDPVATNPPDPQVPGAELPTLSPEVTAASAVDLDTDQTQESIPGSDITRSPTPVSFLDNEGLQIEPQPQLSGADLEDQERGAEMRAALTRAQQQSTLQQRYNQTIDGDWRVRLRLAPNATYLYKAQDPGPLLQPLKDQDGVIFPYLPTITTNYQAQYDKRALTHSNYQGYFYKSSMVGEISITGTFTAQDTREAEYVLGVIHFFRSVTKMFYGQDRERGAPPPLVFLSAFGQYQFNNHPCVVSNFNYNMPNAVDYIRVNPSNQGQNLIINRNRTSSSPVSTIETVINRINSLKNLVTGTPVQPGAQGSVQSQGYAGQVVSGTGQTTYVPTKLEVQITLLPIQTRSQVSQQFSVKQFANGSLLKGGFW